VVTETCGVAGDLVRDGETGYVFRVGEIAAAATILKNLMRDHALRRRLGATVRERVTREYRPEQFADAFVQALDRIKANKIKAAGKAESRRTTR
jgi:glycosyltransferase involved in cell wall biosynthesis